MVIHVLYTADPESSPAYTAAPNQPSYPEQPQIQSRPKVHSMRYHSGNVYVGTTTMPSAFTVRLASSTSSDSDTDDYVVELLYKCNRACSLYRTEDDFRALVSGILSTTDVPNMPSLASPPRIQDLEAVLALAIQVDRRGCAVEYFLRRRMEDCGGH